MGAGRLDTQVLAVELQPQPLGVNGVGLEPLEPGLQPGTPRRPHQKRPAPPAPPQQTPFRKPRQPSPHRHPRHAQSGHQLSLGRYAVPGLVPALQKKVLYASLDLQVEGVTFQRARILPIQPYLQLLRSRPILGTHDSYPTAHLQQRKYVPLSSCATNWY